MTHSSQPTTPLANAPAFIEQQFPVAKVSMESYKERKSGGGQTLTGLGKWWGRKPLTLVRATLLGLLMPASENPEKDREIFLKLMTMDWKGLLQRKSKPIPQVRLLAELANLPPNTQRRFLDPNDQTKLIKLEKGEKEQLQHLVFERMNYAEKLEYCELSEHVDGPMPDDWDEINSYLGTSAKNLIDLVQELGKKRFGHTPKVGDAFCGGGSIPFEAARLGCDAYGSDLNPAATLLTWASLNIIGAVDEVANNLKDLQKTVLDSTDKQITEWGIEHNSLNWRADAYLYCVEAACPDCRWKIPLCPSWIVAEKNNVIANLKPDQQNHRFDIEILENVSDQDLKKAKNGTLKNSRLVCPNCGASSPIQIVRQNLRLWMNEDFTPLATDVYQERLYCIRWIEKYEDSKGIEQHRRHYRAVTAEDLHRENKVIEIVRSHFSEWQGKGYIPSRRIESGYNTDQPIRERGWTFWHHLFTPRQLLGHALLLMNIDQSNVDAEIKAGALLMVGASCNWNSKLCIWNSNLQKGGGAGVSEQTFSNQALNTQYNYGTRGGLLFLSTFSNSLPVVPIHATNTVKPADATAIDWDCDVWITDPPYADAVNYHELSEFFLAWYEKLLKRIFPNWYSDSKRALAIRGGENKEFQQSMIAAYSNLAKHMPENGMQVVMFTHQDATVWADLTMILWAAGLRVTAAWTIATETSSGLKQGNYVQGTVLLVLRKRTVSEPLFLDEVNQKVESEVRRQLDEMTRMEDDSDPNFGDSDYQLAAYAAALRVLTGQPIEEINPEKEILRPRKPGETGPVEALIRRAVKIACDHLVPRTLDGELWKQLNPAERFYLKGLEVESHGEYRSGVYQELARGFGANDYTELLESGKANETRLKSASEFGKKGLSGDGFAGSLVRQCLFAVAQVSKSDETREGLNYLKTELPDYWANREKISHILVYLAALRNVSTVAQWHKDAASAGLLLGAVRNDHV